MGQRIQEIPEARNARSRVPHRRASIRYGGVGLEIEDELGAISHDLKVFPIVTSQTLFFPLRDGECSIGSRH